LPRIALVPLGSSTPVEISMIGHTVSHYTILEKLGEARPTDLMRRL
jgi:hypothetical protein